MMFRFAKFLAALCLFLAGTLQAKGDDIFLYLEGIQGESHDSGHPGWIDVLSFSHSMSRSSKLVPPTHGAITLSKRLDKASPRLDFYCNRGTIIPNATLEFFRLENREFRFYTIPMTNVVVSSIQSSGTDADDVPYESISLTYDAIQWDFTPFRNDGSSDPDIITWWDVSLNKGGTIVSAPDNDNDGIPDDSDPDDDNDGIPDTYEIANGLNPFVNDAAEDLDHDGMSNYDEFIAGTAANDPNSLLRVTRAASIGASVQITWSSVSGKTYEVYSSTNLAGPYTFFSTVSSAGTGETSTTIGNSGGQRFFRIRVLP